MNLPIHEIRDLIVEAFRRGNRVLVEAPTGSGKSTQIPQMLLDSGIAGKGQALILQPRRLATRMLAARVARERNSRLGDEVGYQIRFDNISSARTRIKFITEGVLLRMMLDAPDLPGISAILFDEFHERHLFGDISLARALQLQEERRPDLRLGVMSATLRAAPLKEYMAPCAVLTSQGRAHTVEISYLDRPVDFNKTSVWEVAARELNKLLASGLDGDVLVFMPGAFEIRRTIEAIEATPEGKRSVVLPLHGELPPAEQDAAMERYDRRKIIVSTNVAETSLTIDGVRLVIDSGLARVAAFDPNRGINTLLIEKISRASSDQRAGRAGRTAPGRCLRLWTEREHIQRAPDEIPEIRRLDLSEVVLTLKASGIEDIAGFRWLDAPDPKAIALAERLLRDLGALREDESAGREKSKAADSREDASTRSASAKVSRITPLGRRMLAFPVHPRFSRMLLAAHDFGCVPAIALAAALTDNRGLLVRRPGEHVAEKRDDLLGDETVSDFFLLMRAWNHASRNNFSAPACREAGIHVQAARQVARTFQQFLDIASSQNLNTDERRFSADGFRRCLLVGFSDHVATLAGAGTVRYLLTGGRRGSLSPETAVTRAPLIVATEAREIERRGKEVDVLLSNVTAIEPEWLSQIFPDDVWTRRVAIFDAAQRRVTAREETLFRDLVLAARHGDGVPPERAAAILADEVLAGRCTLKHWDHAVEQWIARVNCLAVWMPDLGLPPLTSDDRKHIIEQICHGASSSREIKDRPVMPIVRSWLSDEQQQWVEKFAPAQVELPKGRKPKITYSEQAAPTIAARIQDLYGLEENLRIANDRVELVVQILAPNQRPVQVTRNIAAFWSDSYPAIKKQLQGRYPKHEWR